MIKVKSNLLDAMADIDKAFDGDNPLKRVDGEVYMRYDELRISKDKVAFLFKGVTLIEYDPNINTGDTVIFTGCEGLARVELR